MDAGGFCAFAEHGIQGETQVLCSAEGVLGSDNGPAFLGELSVILKGQVLAALCNLLQEQLFVVIPVFQKLHGSLIHTLLRQAGTLLGIMPLRFIVKTGNFLVRAGNNPYGGADNLCNLGISHYGQVKAELAEGDQQGQILSVILQGLLAKGSVRRIGQIGSGYENLLSPVVQEQAEMKVYEIRYMVQRSRL